MLAVILAIGARVMDPHIGILQMIDDVLRGGKATFQRVFEMLGKAGADDTPPPLGSEILRTSEHGPRLARVRESRSFPGGNPPVEDMNILVAQILEKPEAACRAKTTVVLVENHRLAEVDATDLHEVRQRRDKGGERLGPRIVQGVTVDVEMGRPFDVTGAKVRRGARIDDDEIVILLASDPLAELIGGPDQVGVHEVLVRHGKIRLPVDCSSPPRMGWDILDISGTRLREPGSKPMPVGALTEGT